MANAGDGALVITIRKLLRGILAQYMRVPVMLPGQLGNGAGVVAVPGRPNYVYCTMLSQGNTVVEVFNACTQEIDGLTVWVGYDYLNPGLLQIMGWRYTGGPPAFVPTTATHAPTHQYLDTTGGTDPVYIQGRAVLPFRVSVSGLTLSLYTTPMFVAGTWGYASPSTTLVPPVSGACWALVEISDASGALIVTTDTPVADKDLLDPSTIPAPTCGRRPVAIVRLYAGQTEIVESRTDSDIIDPRWPGWIGAASGSVIFGSATSGLAEDNTNFYWDDVNKCVCLGYTTFISQVGNILQIASGQATSASVTIANYGTAVTSSQIAFLGAGGDLGTPAATPAAKPIMRLSARGYADGAITTSRARIEILSAEAVDWTAGAQGALVRISTTPVGSITMVPTFEFQANGAAVALAGIVAAKPVTTAGIALDPNAATGNYTLSVSPANLTADRRHTLPDYSVIWPAADAAGYLKSDGAGNLSWSATGGPTHDILSATHTDATASAVARGSIITGQGVSPSWTQLVKGAVGAVLTGDGTDTAWSTYYLAGAAGQTYTFSATGGTVPTGSGTANYGAKFVSATAVGNSLYRDDGTDAGIGGLLGGVAFSVNRAIANMWMASGTSNGNYAQLMFGEGSSAGKYVEFLRYANATPTLGGIFIIDNLTKDILLSTNYTAGAYVNDFYIKYASGGASIAIGHDVPAGRLHAKAKTSGIAGIFDAAASTPGDILQCRSSAGTTEYFAVGITEVTVNESGLSTLDFRVETDSYNGIFLDASNESLVLMSSAAGKLAFWGATAIAQPAGATQVAPAAYATGTFGLDSDAHMQALYDLVVAMRTAMVNSGLMKGAA